MLCSWHSNCETALLALTFSMRSVRLATCDVSFMHCTELCAAVACLKECRVMIRIKGLCRESVP